MTEETIEIPYPEIEREQADKSIREQFKELEAREAREAQVALDERLATINSSGDIAALKADTQLRIQFVNRYGHERFGDLNLKHVQRQTEQRLAAERAAKMSKRTVTTSQGRIAELNKARKAAAK